MAVFFFLLSIFSFFIFVFLFNFFPCVSFFHFIPLFPFCFSEKKVSSFFILFLFFFSRVLKICGTPGFLGGNVHILSWLYLLCIGSSSLFPCGIVHNVEMIKLRVVCGGRRVGQVLPSYQNRQISALDETADAPQSSLFSLLSLLSSLFPSLPFPSLPFPSLPFSSPLLSSSVWRVLCCAVLCCVSVRGSEGACVCCGVGCGCGGVVCVWCGVPDSSDHWRYMLEADVYVRACVHMHTHSHTHTHTRTCTDTDTYDI